MQSEQTTRVVNTFDGLERVLAEIESGRSPKPDWIRLQSHCRLDKLKPERLGVTLKRLHGAVLRGFKASNVEISQRARRLDFWRSVAGAGFHDFSDLGWMKCYDSPYFENYD